jgi:hypothetical protein
VRVACVIGVLFTIALAGCYGSTEPATNIGLDSATLNAQGKANNGPAQAWFKYWSPNLFGSDRTTPKRSLPAGASGPFSERVNGLERGIEYRFQLCGNDAGKAAVCAPSRSFETLGGDRVVGSGTGSSGTNTASLTIDARSGPTGRGPRGEVHGTSSQGGNIDDGIVDCLTVSGNTATVGFHWLVSTGDQFYDQDAFVRVVDTGVAGQDTAHFTITSERQDCSQYVAGQPQFHGDFTVTDAPAAAN